MRLLAYARPNPAALWHIEAPSKAIPTTSSSSRESAIVTAMMKHIDSMQTSGIQRREYWVALV